MRAPCHVGEGLVDGDALDGRREIAQNSDRGVAEPLVFVEMSADKYEVGTELPRAPSRHAASYAEGPRLVGGRENDAAADRNRLAAQARVKQLLDRRIKGVEVRVENGGGGPHLVDASNHIHHSGSRRLYSLFIRHACSNRCGTLSKARTTLSQMSVCASWGDPNGQVSRVPGIMPGRRGPLRRTQTWPRFSCTLAGSFSLPDQDARSNPLSS